MPDDTVLVELDADAGVATVTLNRPDALNALTVPMKQALLAAFRRLEREKPIRAVVLTGAGRAFCAGQDLRERLEPGAAPLGVEVRERYNPIIRAMRGLPKPIVAAIVSHALVTLWSTIVLASGDMPARTAVGVAACRSTASSRSITATGIVATAAFCNECQLMAG